MASVIHHVFQSYLRHAHRDDGYDARHDDGDCDDARRDDSDCCDDCCFYAFFYVFSCVV